MLIQAVIASVIVVAAGNPLFHEPRIFGGQNTTIEKHPYQVSIQYDGSHICGGAIYTPNHIVTAAHCLLGNSSEPFTVRVGSTFREKGGTVYEAKEIRPHPKFNENNDINLDVGVVILKASITYGPTVQPIRLVGVNKEPNHGEMLDVTGWGLTKDDASDSRAEQLQHLRAPFISRELCQKVYTIVTDEMICAGGGNDKGTMTSDSGGPLVNKKGELVGIVSWGSVTLRRGYPGVFVNVASPVVRQYIEENAS